MGKSLFLTNEALPFDVSCLKEGEPARISFPCIRSPHERKNHECTAGLPRISRHFLEF